MQTPWLLAFAALSLITVVDTLLLLGVLRNIGSLEHRMRLAGFDDLDPKLGAITSSGPAIGSAPPEIHGNPLNGPDWHRGEESKTGHWLLIVFLSTTCPSCQRIIEPLNSLSDRFHATLRTVVVMKSDLESARNFLSVFDVHPPVYSDGNLSWPGDDPIHFVPYWTLYDEHGVLAEKGAISQPDGMAVLEGIIGKEVGAAVSNVDSQVLVDG